MQEAEQKSLPDPDVHEFEVTEGYTQLVSHLSRERNKALIKRKKKSVASLECEVCGFDFSQAYGAIAEGYCEIHHLQPLSSATQAKITRLQDLAILCANCHRIIHLRNPPYTIADVKNHLAKTGRDA